MSIRRDQSQKKEAIDYYDRYEKEVMQKLYTEGNIQPIFAIKPKELKPKPKSNIRLQTELITEPGSLGCVKTKNCNSQAGNINQGSSAD